jgi:cysteine desulfurase
VETAYLDNNATTPVSPEAIAAMLPFFNTRFQNVASVAGEALGLRSVLGQARKNVAALLGLDEPEECVFTSGATEANNWAIYGFAESCRAAGHAITTEIEHPSVLEAMRRLETNGWEVTVVPPDQRGLITAEAVSAALREDTRLVSVMMANNETGIIQPVAEIVSAVKAAAPSVTFHTDATQAIGKISVSLCNVLDAVDLVSLSSHKFHGPKGCGALVVRGGVSIPPLMVGGGQEGGRRSGTTNLPAIVGSGVAALEAQRHLANGSYLAAMRDRFESALCVTFPNAVIFGRNELRLPNTSCFALPGQNANALADRLALRGLFVGTGSACSSGALLPPRSLVAMGVAHSVASAAIRVSLSRYSLSEELERLVAELREAVNRAAGP